MSRHRFIAAAGLFAATALALTAAPDKKDAEAAKKGLQEVGDIVGEWKGNGDAKIDGRNTLWKETINLGWRFKNGESWIALESKDGKFITAGELKYLPEKKAYQLTATEKGKEHVYEGKVVKGRLVLDRKDAATGDVHRITLYTLADGARMVLQSEVQSKGKGLFSKQYQVAANNAADSFAGGAVKKPECVVTGGLGTMAVSYNGKTYYVCCSGCRDEFNANPKKYVEEFEKKNKK